MATCRECHDEVDKLVAVKVASKTRKVCESCADRLREQAEVAEASEGVMQGMMGYKGRH
jgi:protein-arginine kinase activator protein McsA